MDTFTCVYREGLDGQGGGGEAPPLSLGAIPANPRRGMPNPSALWAAFAATPLAAASPSTHQGAGGNAGAGGGGGAPSLASGATTDTLLHAIYMHLQTQQQDAKQQWTVLAALVGGVALILMLYLERLHSQLRSLELTLASRN
jgi:hypothetical protein